MHIKSFLIESLFIFLFINFSSNATQQICPQLPQEGFGTPGKYAVQIDSLHHAGWRFHHVYLFKPLKNDTTKLPLVFFCHGMGADEYSPYKSLLTTIASNGYLVVYAPYSVARTKNAQEEQYDVMRKGIVEAVHSLSGIIDTTRIAIVGHSFGGGAVPSITWRLLNEDLWGGEAACMFIMAPWYMLNITNEMLESFPDYVKMIVQVYDDDRINDQRIAIDIFNAVAISPASKEFITVKSDRMFGCNLLANHSTPTDQNGHTILHVNGIYRPLCALLDYSLKNDTAAYIFALGHGDTKQVFMGKWKNGTAINQLIVSSDPQPMYQQNYYLNFWKNHLNPRYTQTLVQQSRFKTRIETMSNYFQAGRYFFKIGKRDMNETRKSTGPVPPIDSGYGSMGPYDIIVDTISNPSWNGKPVYVFLPSQKNETADSKKRYPVTFFAHGFSKSNPSVYRLIIENVVSRGAACIFVPYPNVPRFYKRIGNYETMFNGISSAVTKYKNIIDTNRIGVIGHSFGAGAAPWITSRAIKNNWGKNSSFMFIMAPWYVREITKEQLQAFPPDVKMIVQIYNDDIVNDPLIAVNLFNTIGIADSNKNFIQLYSDSSRFYSFIANHSVPKSGWTPEGTEDGYDYYGVLRPLDALIDYTFNGNKNAKSIALSGGKDKRQCYMGIYPDGKPVREMDVSFNAKIDTTVKKRYLFNWNNTLNPLKGN